MRNILIYTFSFLCGILFAQFILHSILKKKSDEYIKISEHNYMMIHQLGYLDGVESGSIDNWPSDSLKAVKRFHAMCDESEQ